MDVVVQKFTASQLGEGLNYNPTTIRGWGRKPKIGEVYNPNVVNNDFVRSQLRKLFGESVIKEKFGCSIDEIELIKSTISSGSSVNLTTNDLVVGEKYLFISHVNRLEFILKGITEVDGEKVFILERCKVFVTNQDKYRVLTENELSDNSRWTMRKM